MKNINRYSMLTTNEIEAKGWVLEQLKIQAKGLSGNLHKVWPDVRDSQWIGGDKEGWERVPYWLDGFIPLAYLLNDEELKATAKKYVDAIISKQEHDPETPYHDGWICPYNSILEFDTFDEWAVLLICKAFIVYYDCSGDERIPDVIYKILKNLKFRLEHTSLKSWGSFRWFEGLISVYWMYDRCREDWLIELCRLLEIQGADYHKIFDHWKDQERHYRSWRLHTHVVNLAMALKSDALAARFLNDEYDQNIDPDEFAEHMLSTLHKYHGTCYGYFTGDECISGDSPIQGTELCGVVEAMYSYEWLYAVTGREKWVDRLEALAFNALPAGTSDDMWVRQYDQMSNQVACPRFPGPHYETHFCTNGNDGNMFGLEPNYGCCTANFNQGWPKLVLSSFMRNENALCSVAHVPAKATVDMKGAKVEVELITMYPFRNKLTYVIKTDKPVEFDFEFIIPSTVNSATVNGKKADAGKFVVSKLWEGETTIEVVLDEKTEFIARPNNMFALRHGALLYSLPIKEEWTKMEYTEEGIERKFPYCDYQVMPKSDWNYAYSNADVTFEDVEDYDIPFSSKNPPKVAYANMHKINWGWDERFEGFLCRSEPLERAPISETEKIKLLPYGCPKLRMTEMPLDKE
ncbi:MAG: hypothetical protein E7591_05055 [Ruminococcaceae bacterium]|nr:hypothetical protein [Oscillospiraceae bacterium]